LIDELVAGNPSNALDVGCGTGKVAVPLMERGLSVLGIEPDDRMASVARRHGVPVEVGSFESWEPAGRTYDLLTAGHSWHWIDPAVGIAKAASIMMPGGIVTLFWNYHVVEEPLLAAFDDAYRTHAPELTAVGHDPSGSHDLDPFRGSNDFVSFGSRTYRWSRVLDGDEWTSMLATLSDHAALGESHLKDLQRALRGAVKRSGGLVRSRCGTYLWKAQRTAHRT
jgi:SAM-dependent methyltransferase